MRFQTKFAVFAAFVLLIAAPAFAQTTATLTGTVTTDGKPLPGATVTITSPSFQGFRTSVTGENGGYVFPALPPGEYSIGFELEGLQSVSKSARLQLAQTARADADLKVSAMTEAITVTASVPSMLENSQVATHLEASLIDRLPLVRTVLATACLAPGVTPNTVSGRQVSISGSPGYDNLIMVNGVVITENVRSQAALLFIEDAIQETTVLAGAISAEYGRFTGGVVNSITKSGGNQFSGSFRDSRTNPSWTERTPFAGQVRGIDKANDIYEATLGGYVLRDRLWFFGAGRQEESVIARSTFRTNLAYAETFADERYEGKLTGQITPKHNLVASYLDKTAKAQNSRFASAIYDLFSLTPRSDPEALLGVFYNGVIANNLLLEGRYSERKWNVSVGGGSRYTDLLRGTLLRNRADGLARFNSPTSCGVCENETRNNDGWVVKGNYYRSTNTMGGHNLIAGIENFSQHLFASKHQSGSDFTIDVTDVVRVPGSAVPLLIDGTAVPRTGSSTRIRWTPIFVGANENDLATQSAFINDRWNLSKHWSFNIGLRYDKNNSVDANGNKTSDDRNFSPRLTAVYDLRGDGRNRFTASYNKYVSQIGEGPGTSAENAGRPATVDFNYTGPAINPVGTTTANLIPAHQAVQMIFGFFNSQCNAQGQCGVQNLSLLRPGGSREVPGFSNEFRGSLKSPNVDEITVGYGMQVGRSGFARVDVISRDWNDFYNFRIDSFTPVKTDFLGISHDIQLVESTNNITREYRGVQFQGSFRPSRFNIGINYTYATLEGNDTQEDASSGNVGNHAPGTFYPEYYDYAQNQPVGYLPGDVRHRARGWISYDLPWPSFLGNLNVSVLQSYDSALPYSAVGTIDFAYTGAPNIARYSNPPTDGTYFFSDRGEFRVDDITRTDFAVNYTLPIWRVQLFVQADLLNALGEDGIEAPGFINTAIMTRFDSANFAPFHPFTVTPKECPRGVSGADCKAMGAHFQKSVGFGTPSSASAYQLARTYRFAAGVRF